MNNQGGVHSVEFLEDWGWETSPDYDDNMEIEKKENNNNIDDDFFSISSGQHEIETPSDAQSPSSPGINGKPQLIMGSMLAGNGSDDGSSGRGRLGGLREGGGKAASFPSCNTRPLNLAIALY